MPMRSPWHARFEPETRSNEYKTPQRSISFFEVFFLKKFSIFLIAFVMILSSCASKQPLTVDEIFLRYASAVEMPSCEIYRPSGENSENSLPQKLYQNSDAFSYCSEYLICLYQGNEIWEIHILKTASEYDNPKAIELLLERRDLLQKEENMKSYSEESMKRVNEAMLIEKGRYLILAVTDRNDILKDLLEN